MVQIFGLPFYSYQGVCCQTTWYKGSENSQFPPEVDATSLKSMVKLEISAIVLGKQH